MRWTSRSYGCNRWATAPLARARKTSSSPWPLALPRRITAVVNPQRLHHVGLACLSICLSVCLTVCFFNCFFRLSFFTLRPDLERCICLVPICALGCPRMGQDFSCVANRKGCFPVVEKPKPAKKKKLPTSWGEFLAQKCTIRDCTHELLYHGECRCGYFKDFDSFMSSGFPQQPIRFYREVQPKKHVR